MNRRDNQVNSGSKDRFSGLKRKRGGAIATDNSQPLTRIKNGKGVTEKRDDGDA